ncbi:MAG: hypothetical protein UZ21_OP11001000613 [Microgenomates bacterium OLB22]|nr:MAG: hypothetical protein UZ21_OP11001000613 [Microgenomates bacterium OLB22]
MSLSPIVFTLNKVALFAFLVTFGLIIYELFHILKKKNSTETKQVEVPDFHPEEHEANQTFTPLHIENKKEVIAAPPNRAALFLVVGGLLLIGGVFIYALYGGWGKPVTRKSATTSPTVIRQASSAGIVLYDTSWQPLKDQQILALQPNDFIFIGLKSLSGVDISKARIRVNKKNWDLFDETAMYNAQENVYYREFFISSESASLHIEGELFDSKSGSWLGETSDL